jgi:hypothetical protein
MANPCGPGVKMTHWAEVQGFVDRRVGKGDKCKNETVSRIALSKIVMGSLFCEDG